MPRDYAKNSANRNRDSSAREGLSNWVWLLIGIVLGLVIAYAATHQSQLAGFAKSSESMLSKTEKGATASVAKSHHGKEKDNKGAKELQSLEAKDSNEAKEDQSDKQSQQHKTDQDVIDDAKKPASPKFDFYTLLPKSQVATAEATNKTNNKSVVESSATTTPKAVVSPKVASEKTTSTKALSLREEAISKQESSSTTEEISPPNTDVNKTSGVENLHENADESSADASQSSSDESGTKSSATLKEVQSKPEAKSVKTQLNSVKKSVTTPESAAPFYSLQVAMFSSYGEADRLKAELILLGFEPSIKTIKKKDATWYRVWLGPYHNYDVVQSVQSQLQSKHIKSVLLKENA